MTIDSKACGPPIQFSSLKHGLLQQSKRVKSAAKAMSVSPLNTTHIPKSERCVKCK